MLPGKDRIIVVAGAAGLQGGAVARALLKNGWHVRALTRNPNSESSKKLASMGAEVVQGDMEKPETLAPVFENAYGVYNVQNPVISGADGEIRQGKNMAYAAHQAGVQHVVYGSAGTGSRGTGIPSWETKLVIQEAMQALNLPLTILRPMAFMELMTHKKFYPQMSTWSVMPRLMGEDRIVGWLSAEDLGTIAARVFADPTQFLGRDLKLASDIKTINECRSIYQEFMGKAPPSLPMPVWLFERFGFVGQDLGRMWRWLRNNEIVIETDTACSIYPEASQVRAWLQCQ
jgi:uncharacterized protein YbjT (DUF2867 family)